MDEVLGITEAQFKKPLPIPNNDFVYRQVHKNELNKESRRYPQASHFKLKGDPDLSVHWNAYINVDEVYHIIGLSYNKKGSYKDIKLFDVFQFPIDFLRNLESIEKVVHSPVFNGNPAPVGHPNNFAHTSVHYPDDEEIRKKLSNYCNDEYANAYCTTNFKMLESVVEELRKKLNTTKYHCCKKDTP